MATKYFVLDYETEAIQGRPAYPPKPVGCSIRVDGVSKYWSWAHPTGNTCSEEQFIRYLHTLWGTLPVVMHNAKFDYDVATTHQGMPALPWDMVHDTMFLVFLVDPHATTFALKESAERLLGIAPEERDFLKDYVLTHISCKPSEWGAHIAECPGDVVGAYADGDVLRTEELYLKLLPQVKTSGMYDAYNRERRLMPILLESEREGINLDVSRLEQELPQYEAAMTKIEAWVYDKLGAGVFNLDSNDELADALIRFDPETSFLLTPTGRRSVSKDSLAQAVKDPEVFTALGYRSRLSTCLSMFMRPWLAMGADNGKLLPSWSQVRQISGDKGSKGARTGRLICAKPNLLNLSKDFEGRNDGYSHPQFIDVPVLPLVRKYLLPEKGDRWLHRDYSQQELRILGHFEDDMLCEQYNAEPDLDVHEFVRKEIKRILGIDAERRQTKILNFGMIYGMGVGKLAESMGVDVGSATKLKNAQRKALPGLKDLEQSLKSRGRADRPIRTWGGRAYYTEPPKLINGRMCTFEYKLLNYLIQGSAADCTKEAVIRYHDAKKDGKFLVTVYDEINISAPKRAEKSEMKLLREIMQGIEFDVPMLSDGKVGDNWSELSKYKDE